MRVVEAVSAAREVDPVTLTPPLSTVIDPDALNTLFETESGSDVTIEFTYADHSVYVSADELLVRPLTEAD